MFVRLLATSFLLILVVQSTFANNSKGQNIDSFKLEKHELPDDDYDMNEQKLSGNIVEGSGGGAIPEDYPDDDEEEEELRRITARTSRIVTTATTTTPTTTTTATTSMRTTRRTMTTTIRTTVVTTTTTMTPAVKTTSTVTTPLLTPWTKPTFNYESRSGKGRSTTTTLSTFNDLDGNEFKDDQDYPDDLEDDADYNELALTTKLSTTQLSTTRYTSPTTSQPVIANHAARILVIFKFLTRPPIARGILAGLAIGIFTSILLLICIIQRYHKRDKSHSSYTTGLLYPNHYGYSKSPQEFYA